MSSRPDPPAELWLVRHGETVGGSSTRLYGAAGRTLLVLHKGVVKIVVGMVLVETPEIYSTRACELGSLYLLERRGDGWRLGRPCLVEHLGVDRLPSSR